MLHAAFGNGGRAFARRVLPLALVLGLLLSLAPVQGWEAATVSPEGAGPAGSPSWLAPPTADAGGRFIENLGQWRTPARFVADTPFGHAALCADGVVYDLVGEDGGHRVKVAFDAEAPVEPVGVGDMGYPASYFLGNDPERWVTGARSYREVIYRDVWPGTDVRYRFSEGVLKYDLVLDGDADPSLARFDVEGAEGLEVGADGLDIHLSRGLALHDRGLVAWYGDGEAVDVSFAPSGDGYGFAVDKDPGRTMVIDPVVVHSSSFVGGTYDDYVMDVDVDRQGNVYALAYAGSADYPVTPGAYDEEVASADAAVTKFDHNCSRIIWSTFVGGTSWDFVSGMDLDEDNAVYFAGYTWSSDFPTTEGALNSEFNLGQNTYQMDPYVVKLNPLGTALVYSTYVGGSHTDSVGDLKVRDGRAAVVGYTNSVDFPTEYGSYGGIHGDGFLFVLDENGSAIVDTCFWGGFGGETAASLEFATNGDIVVGGRTSSMDLFTTPGAFQRERPAFNSGFLARYSTEEDRLVFCTYVGGAAGTSLGDVTVDEDDHVYLSGSATTGGGMTDFITTPGAYQEEFASLNDAFLGKMDPNGTRLEYLTLLGGDGDEYVYDIELDTDGHLVAAGALDIGTNFSVTPGCHDPTWNGDSEGFILVLDDDGSAPLYSSFHGGSNGDGIYAVEIDDAGNLVVGGATFSQDLPLADDAFQGRLSGASDGLVSIVGELAPTSAPRNLTATGREGSILVEWERPGDDGGHPVRGYVLLRGASEAELRPHRVLDRTASFVDEEVDWGAWYHYAVIADNWKGSSPRSNVASARSVTVPDPPVNMTGSVGLDSVVIEWEPPVFTGGLPITGYMLYRIAQGGHLELVTPVGPDALCIEDEMVADGTTYTYTMTALNEFGESGDRASVTLRTHRVPSPPRGLDHTYGDLFIRLEWEPPEDDWGLPVLRYSVYRWEGTGDRELVGSVTAPGLTLTDTGVEVGAQYGYSVTAVNAKGEGDPSDAVLAVARVRPGPPTATSAAAQERFVKVTWSPPASDGASPLMGYRVYLVAGDGSTLLGGTGPDSPMVFLHDVPYDGAVRRYRVTAFNAEGESDPGPLAATSLHQAPDAPRDTVLEEGDGRLDLSWAAPLQDGGAPVLTFTLYRTTPGLDPLPLVVLPAGALSFSDDVVQNGVEYVYFLTCSNLVGESLPSPEVRGVPAGLPDPPEGLTAGSLDGSARLAWWPPGDTGGLPVVGYLVYAVTEGSEPELLVELGPDGLDLLVKGLANGRIYLFAVRTSTAVGLSELSAVAEARPLGPPGPPEGLEAVWGDGHVTVTWSPPQDTGGSPVLGYRIRRGDMDAANWTDVAGTTYRDDDVAWEASYVFTVYALTAAGRGPEVNVTLTVPEEPAEPPEPSRVRLWPLIVIGLVLAVALAVMMTRARVEEG